MILLLSGASETARMMIIDAILDAHKDWRHLALEDLREEDNWEQEAIGMEEVFGTMIACDYAKDALAEGSHVIISCPSVYLVGTVRDAFDSEVTTIHMGDQGEGDEEFSHVLHPQEHSLKQTSAFLEKLITT